MYARGCKKDRSAYYIIRFIWTRKTRIKQRDDLERTSKYFPGEDLLNLRAEKSVLQSKLEGEGSAFVNGK